MTQHLFLSLGGNLGNTREIFEGAYPHIEKKIGKIAVYSSIYQTEAWGPIPQADFLNQVLLVSTSLKPEACLTELLEIERQFGRERKERWGPRTLDLDILFYGDVIIAASDLSIPHPRIAERKFILTPLAEIAPLFEDPTSRKSMTALLAACADESQVNRSV
ncbi:2-amino-4-hydroxy-6-hydroxymethyldihydropteridine diphosphokinase [Aquirufa antheringensis]|jgi:2-amino-4-hydroxy-6-hydroxymethyldihydropteridine diphosphokinase|uniref:2-amino-4-hydroxy-6- hydroxymethyldihydropteridine diphosphokinase n=1 Tax=Aquirufa antheringensis TaxID=2516559 RepID=UPI00208F8A83|nr:2-amino-4-hydroxy-6-hydroxymethyldihydropteridine diphosphokinase [Aquirufa antheringensis]MCZ2484526.1 2-amino-4-hydroxy-6-hydroxymethyldihydropteridine diphosphokinase [Aquirufa antheringensis]MCZ2489570.1 2-amino-4-hydroxy-6-hydroxymethyldihydropteridine diphosphokinase [Aquirufa antheringensis]USQ02868.1 2-amino-4-hydroxy-6-hydroxymethyldihydropteridine diphosphokinase [Aquirufa antheringensis]